MDYFTINSEKAIKNGAFIELFDIASNEVVNYSYEKGKLYDIQKLKSGTYFLRIEGINKNIVLLKN